MSKKFTYGLFITLLVLSMVVGTASPALAQDWPPVVGPGFAYGPLFVDASVQTTDEVIVPYPTGAADVTTVCAVSAYRTEGEKDLGWYCSSVGDPARREIRFELGATHGDKGIIGALGIVFDTAIFEVIESQPRRFDYTGDGNRSSYPVPFSTPPGTIQFISVNTYQTGSDDDVSYQLLVNMTEQSALPEDSTAYQVDIANGNRESYVDYRFLTIRPKPGVWWWHEAQQVYDGDQFPVLVNIDPGMHTVAFSTLTTYATGRLIDSRGDGDFSVDSFAEYASSAQMRFNMFGDRGDGSTLAVFQLYVIQIPWDYTYTEDVGAEGDAAGAQDAAPQASSIPVFTPAEATERGATTVESRSPASPITAGQGRLVVGDPGAAGYWVYIAGTETQVGGAYGDWSYELSPGEYEIRNSYRETVGQVTVRDGLETVASLDTGKLAVSDPGAAGHWVYIAGTETQVGGAYGDWTYGLYGGEYEIRNAAGEVVARAVVGRGQITDADLDTGKL
ncbi:MAG: hypothetical protein JXB47_11505, partial [Anaerolineae bacterium]|nr:hypothetical protein [Anaerolineae bacterium]